MAVNETGPALQTLAFATGALKGTQLTLYPACLVHRSDAHLETLPLAGFTAVRVAFAREPRKLGWGIALVLAALLLLFVAGPLEAWANRNVVELAKSPEGVQRLLYGVSRTVEVFANILPILALLCVIGGGMLCAFGWMGSTVLFITLPGAERVYAVRGRDTRLLDFSEALSERLMVLKR
jgi:hypothetical protein